MAGFDATQKAIVLFRDGGKCCLCGGVAEVANHRINRGMGGRNSLNRLSNACALCHICNGLIESDASAATLARTRGIKLDDGTDPAATPYLSPFYGIPVWVRDDGDLTFTAPDTEGDMT